MGYNELSKIYFFLYFKDTICSIYNDKIEEEKGIFSISKSTLENKIFIYLSDKKVKIISYDFTKNILNFSEIIDNNIFNKKYSPNYYYKCIQLSAGL